MKLRALALAFALVFAPVTLPIVVAPVAAQTTSAPTAPASTTTEVSSTSTAPVTTTISVGTWASETLKWVWTVVGTVLSTFIGGYLIGWLRKLAAKAGVELTDAMKAQLQGQVVNGINAFVAASADWMKGKGQVEIKNELTAYVLGYVQTHGVDVLKKLGVDIQSADFKESIAGRVEKALNDPAAPTPPQLTPATAGGSVPAPVVSAKK